MLCRIYFGSTEREIRCGLSRVRVTGSCHFPGAPTRRRIPRASKRWLAFVLQSLNAISIVQQISSSFTPLEIKIETPPMLTEFQSQEPPHAFGIPVSRTPPCLRNSKMPPVVRYGYFLESPIVQFQKIPILPPQGVLFCTPIPTGNSSLASYFASKISTFKTPLPLGIDLQ